MPLLLYSSMHISDSAVASVAVCFTFVGHFELVREAIEVITGLRKLIVSL